MAKTRTSRYDVAEHLRTPEEMAAYLEACLDEADGNAAFVAKALGDIARAKGMTEVARDAGPPNSPPSGTRSGSPKPSSPPFSASASSRSRKGRRTPQGPVRLLVKEVGMGSGALENDRTPPTL